MLFFKETTTPAPTPAATTPALTYQPDICKTLGHGMKEKSVILIIKFYISGSPITLTHTSGCAAGWTQHTINGTKKCFKFIGRYDHVDAMEKCCDVGAILPSPKPG